jgi:hypothetical protein
LNIDVKVTGQDDRNVAVRFVIGNDFLDAVGVLYEGLKETALDFGVRGIRMQIHYTQYKPDAFVDDNTQQAHIPDSWRS